MLHLEAKWSSKQSILTADTILAESGSEPGFKVWGSKCIFKEKTFCFYCILNTNFSEHNKIWGDKKDWG